MLINPKLSALFPAPVMDPDLGLHREHYCKGTRQHPFWLPQGEQRTKQITVFHFTLNRVNKILPSEAGCEMASLCYLLIPYLLQSLYLVRNEADILRQGSRRSMLYKNLSSLFYF